MRGISLLPIWLLLIVLLVACGTPTEPANFIGTDSGASSSASFAKGKTGLGGLARSLDTSYPDKRPPRR